MVGIITALDAMNYVDTVRVAAVCHMLSNSMSLVERRGEAEVNPGIKDAVDNYSKTLFINIPTFDVAKVAQAAVDKGDFVLKSIDAPNEVTRCLATAFLIVKMVDAGELSGHTTLAAAALGIVMESEDREDEVWRMAVRPRKHAEEMYKKLGGRGTIH